MAGLTYKELLRMYEKLKTAAERRRFLKDHPNFAERYEAGPNEGYPDYGRPGASPSGGGGGGNQGSGKGKGTVTGGVEGTLPGPTSDPAPTTPPPSTSQQKVVTEQDGLVIEFDPNTGVTYLYRPPDGKRYRVNMGRPLTPEELSGYIAEYFGFEEDPGWQYPGSDGPGPDQPDEETPDEDDEEEEPEVEFDNDLMARISDLLSQYGLDTPELLAFAREAISKGWSINEFMLELRRHPGYLANPLFAANIERTKGGARFMSEGEVLAWATESRRLAKQYGYNEPSDNYLAEGLKSGLSLAEIEHRFTIQDRINLYGAGVRMAAEEMGFELGDADLFEIFDPEKDTKEWEDMFRRAQMRGRPLTLGLGIRSEAEARAWEMMGLSPDEVFSRMEDVAGNRSRFERLGAIEENVRKGLPDNFGAHLMTAENGLLIQALVFQRPDALAKLQQMTAQEIARFKGGGGAAGSGAGLKALTSS